MKTLVCLWLAVLVLAPTLADACQQFRDITHDRNGNVLVGVQVTVTRNGSSSPATIYTDPSCETISANPIVSASTGEFIFYALDGQYDLSFVKSGYTFINITNLSIYEPLGQNVVTLGSFQTDDICAPGIGAIDRIGATVTELVINRPATCSESKTSPSNITLRFEGQGTITTLTPFTFTVAGYVKPAAGRLIWLGTGSYVFGENAGPTPFGGLRLVSAIYGPIVALDAGIGRTFIIAPTDNAAFTVSVPFNPGIGQWIRIVIKNISGGALGTVTWHSIYKMGAAWTNPANAKSRSIDFYYNGTDWVEANRSAADIAN